MHWWDVPKLFFVYSELRIVNSLRQMAKQHTTTLKFKTYSVGRLVDVIWDENWDAEYFMNNSTKMSFGKLIHDMYDPNPQALKTIQQVVRTLMGPPYNWITLDECYQRQP
jgi:nitrogen-specific signal transduction histidine kinase